MYNTAFQLHLAESYPLSAKTRVPLDSLAFYRGFEMFDAAFIDRGGLLGKNEARSHP